MFSVAVCPVTVTSSGLHVLPCWADHSATDGLIALCGKAEIKGQETPILDTSGEKFSWVCFTFLEVVLQLGFKGPGGMFGHCQNIPAMPSMPDNWLFSRHIVSLVLGVGLDN